MRSKKSSSADLNKKSSFYLAIGLFLVLLISWRAIEWKNYDDCISNIRFYNLEKKRVITNIYNTLKKFPLLYLNLQN